MSTPDPVPAAPAPVVAPAPATNPGLSPAPLPAVPSTPASKPSEWTVIEGDVSADAAKVETDVVGWPTWAKIAAAVAVLAIVVGLILQFA